MLILIEGAVVISSVGERPSNPALVSTLSHKRTQQALISSSSFTCITQGRLRGVEVGVGAINDLPRG